MSDLLEEIEAIARGQIDVIHKAVKGGYALDFDQVRKLETLTRVISLARAESRRAPKDDGIEKLSDAELDAILRGSSTVERLALTQEVEGSNPSAATKVPGSSKVERSPVKRGVGGSSPSRAAKGEQG